LLHIDRWLIAVNKPSGELVHPGWARGEVTTMARVRDAVGERVHPVHRLDRGTSGVLLFARNKDTLRALQARWSEAEKTYLALVRGRPPEEGVIDHAVRRGERGHERVPAVTRFVRRGVSPVARCSLVEATPLTGRLHQIRRHFKHISHPLIGDVRYGKGAINRAFRSDYELHRLALHAARLRFIHPDSGVAMAVHAPLPDDLGRPLERLGLRE
jgi:tRNA pseudouridine65 synthase